MYERVEKPKENKSRAVASSVAQKKRNEKQGFGFVDNRSKVVAQRKLQELANKSPRNQHLAQLQKLANNYAREQEHPIQTIPDNAEAIQLAKVTVRNQTDSYTSGWVQAETQSTGVDTGPQAEAQRVQDIAGGTWVGGHMVNDRLGGTGGYDNIVPITSSMNGKHKTIENAARNKVGIGLGLYEAKYNMGILDRDDFNFTNGDEIINLPVKFEQSYDYRLKTGGAITSVQGEKLSMFDASTQTFT